MDKLKNGVAWLFGTALTYNAAVFLPQLYKIWATKDISGISILTFTSFCAVQAIGTAHGIIQKDKALAIGMGLSLITCGAATLSVVYLRYIA